MQTQNGAFCLFVESIEVIYLLRSCCSRIPSTPSRALHLYTVCSPLSAAFRRGSILCYATYIIVSISVRSTEQKVAVCVTLNINYFVEGDSLGLVPLTEASTRATSAHTSNHASCHRFQISLHQQHHRTHMFSQAGA